MMSRVMTVGALAVVLSLLVPVEVLSQPTAIEVEPFTVLEETWISDRLLEVTFSTPRLDPPSSELSVRVLLPVGWQHGPDRFPVVYLLHGAGGRADSWTEKTLNWPTSLEEFSIDKEVVFVMPDGGTEEAPGFYTDWYNQGRFGPPEWETHFFSQLVPWVEERFPVRTDRNGRVVGGVSMGGFGAMSYAARHPDLFAGAVSLSGAVDLVQLGRFALVDPPPQASLLFEALGLGGAAAAATTLTDAFGTFSGQEVRYRAHNPVDLAANLGDVSLFLQTGGGLPGGPSSADSDVGGLVLEAAIRAQNEKMRSTLDDLAIEHQYVVVPRSGHNWYHWQQGLQERAWPLIEEVFARSLSSQSPAAWTYRSAEPTFSVWGFDVARLDAPMEFLTVDVDESRRLLDLTGSGTVEVVTPPWFTPRQPVKAELVAATEGDAAIVEEVVRADRSGRATLTIHLGKPHAFQQYTPKAEAAQLVKDDYWQSATIALPLPRSDRP